MFYMNLKNRLSKISISFKEKFLCLAMVFALTYMVFDYFIYVPVSRQEKEINNELESIEQKFRDDIKDISSLAGIRNEISLMEKKLEFCRKNLSIPSHSVKHLARIARLCEKLNMRVLSIKPGEDGFSVSGYKSIFFELDLISDFKTIAVFLKEIKTLTVFSIVENIDIQQEGNSPHLQFRIVLKAFFPEGDQGELNKSAL